MKNRILLSLFILLSACNMQPDGEHIPAAKMSKILYDVHLAEAYSTSIKNDTINQRHNQKNMDSLAKFYNDIFAHYNITKEQYIQSIAWYREHTDELDSLYTNLIPELSKQEVLQQGKH